MAASRRWAALLLVVAVACKGGDDDVDDGTGPDLPGDADATVADALLSDLMGLGQAFLLPNGPGCVSASSTLDSDADGISDDVTYQYDPTGCRYDFDGGYGTISGTLRVVDKGVPFGFDAMMTDLRYTEVQSSPAQTIQRTLMGTRTLGGTPQDATLSVAVTVAYERTGEVTATMTETWQARFQSTGAGLVLGPGQVLPQGSDLTVTGTTTWLKPGVVSYGISFETGTPMRWAAGCGCPWPSSGEVRARLTSGGPSGYLRYSFSGCWGDIDVEFVEG
jgi:hypothetical protein